MKDAYSNLLVKTSLAPTAARTASANGTAVDRAEDSSMYQDCLIVIQAGVVTDGTHTFEVQDSDDNSSWAAVADTYLQGSEPAVTSSTDDTVYEIGYKGLKRYVRVITTVSGSPATGGLYAALVVLSNPRVAPVVRN
ncbi:hypothetical protein [Streptomyces stelliscabiei]|uniref:Uncharacterized protein n=1 Tax=Streptomyces stelliscabiei TaxID=146820 RepID=A0A8I0TTF6_9ACTN|nr:hypothetical protein [Streptomyces stelliscabiei]KND29919.1 hypothetical protein IQ64_41605 [Streptomyces stelliscabiei]MBE1598956.1 hypothetical protein [Streptomyces stelliscabiei]